MIAAVLAVLGCSLLVWCLCRIRAPQTVQERREADEEQARLVRP